MADSRHLGDINKSRYLHNDLTNLDEIWSENVKRSSKIKPRLRAEWVVLSEEFWILASCLVSPMRRNSVLDELRVRRFAVIQEEI